MPVIILKGVNASDLNLGQIEIGLSSETKNILAMYGETYSSGKEYALDNFIKGLQTAGLWNKISNLYIPCFTNEKLETTFVNLKNANIDAVPNTSSYKKNTDKGVIGLGDTVSDKIEIPVESINSYDFHCLFYNMNDLTAPTTNQTQISVLGYFQGSEWIKVGLAVDAINEGNPLLSYSLGTTTDKKIGLGSITFVPNSALRGLSIISNSKAYYLQQDTIIKASQNGLPDYYNNTGLNIPVMCDAYGKTTNPISLGILSIGNGLTEDELGLYKGLIDTFIKES